MRRVLAILGASALLFTAVGGAAANAPFREQDHVQSVGCWDVETQLGTAYFDAFLSDAWGPDAFLDVWDGDELMLSRDWDQSPSVAFGSDGSVALSIPLVPSGTAFVTGTLTPADSIDFAERFRDGNSWYRSSATGTAFAFTGWLSLPGLSPVAVGPDNCWGQEVEIDTFITLPHAFVSTFTAIGGTCALENDDGDTAFVFIDSFIELGDGGTATAILSLFGSAVDSGGAEVGFDGAGAADEDGVASFETFEYDPATGEPLGTSGSATVSMVDTGDTFSYTLRGSNGFERNTGVVLDVGGQVVTSIGTFSLEPCIATMREAKRVDTPSSGPKPSGKRPANDLPSGAITAKAGFRQTLLTKGAQVPSEADYPCLLFTDPFDGTSFQVPVEHTVWYRIAGTGSPVTVDTAGSDFDTVVAAYAGTPDAAATVACVDDVPLQPVGRTLQSAVTFETAVGTTYWVQIGGLNEDVFGPDSWVPYGNLKVAVR